MRQVLRPQTLPRHCTRLCGENSRVVTVDGILSLSIRRRYTTISKSAPVSISNSSRSVLQTLRKSKANLPLDRRPFINIPDIFSNNNNNNNNNNKPQNIRTLRASRILPFPPAPLYEIIASVESYAEFLPFLAKSTVTVRDPASGYPSQAYLTVGYGPFTEKFTSRVICDRSKWTVEAKSGGGVADDGEPIPGRDEGLFSHLSTKWELVPRSSAGSSSSSQGETEVQLEIRFRFENPLHTAMMSAVEDQVADAMIKAFERRIKEQMTLNR